MALSYYNLDPWALEQERIAARRVGVTAIEVPSVEFDRLAAEGEPMIYVVAGDQLLVSERQVMGVHITHAVLADGGPVQAAGEFEVVESEGAWTVMTLNSKSGHYRPGSESVEVAIEAFTVRGCRVLPKGVERYDGLTP